MGGEGEEGDRGSEIQKEDGDGREEHHGKA